MPEFTGERVIPGHVDDDLWSEHLARYAFAARFASGKRVLDLGCGTGYGTAELAKSAASAAGIDVSAEAIAYAREHYPGIAFSIAPAETTTLSASSFDLITAFELIEHLPDWRPLLAEARRLLAPGGMFLVSTPNREYYGRARGDAGPNPFHVHEFDYAEFRCALAEYFPHTRILMQDRLESFGFYEPATAAEAHALIARAEDAARHSHFYLALCRVDADPPEAAFVYVPRAVNLLREREEHVAKLEASLAETLAERDSLLAQHRALEQHVKEKNEWALGLEAQLQAAQARIVELQNAYAAEQSSAIQAITNLETTVRERTEWAQSLNRQTQDLSAQLACVRVSRWMKLGRIIGLGPRINH